MNNKSEPIRTIKKILNPGLRWSNHRTKLETGKNKALFMIASIHLRESAKIKKIPNGKYQQPDH